eukprot:scaffold154029_cov54-Attheya_sp.AAC.1
MKCGCLSILQNRCTREAVCRFTISFGKKSRKSQLQQCIDWYRYAQPTRKENIVFLIPFDAAGDTDGEEEEEGDIFPQELVAEHKICVHSLMTLCGLGKSVWTRIKSLASAGSIAPNHATRFVREQTGLVTERDNDDSAVYLPTSMGKRHCYGRYCLARGYKIETDNVGNTTILEDEDFNGTRKECPSWTMYWRFWKKNYPEGTQDISSQQDLHHRHSILPKIQTSKKKTVMRRRMTRCLEPASPGSPQQHHKILGCRSPRLKRQSPRRQSPRLKKKKKKQQEK